jgi:hypothetical protein
MDRRHDLQPGRIALVCYDIDGPDMWHERMLTGHVTADEWVVLSPDLDMFTEALSVTGNPDLRRVRFRTPLGALPPGIPAARGRERRRGHERS